MPLGRGRPLHLALLGPALLLPLCLLLLVLRLAHLSHLRCGVYGRLRSVRADARCGARASTLMIRAGRSSSQMFESAEVPPDGWVERPRVCSRMRSNIRTRRYSGYATASRPWLTRSSRLAATAS